MYFNPSSSITDAYSGVSVSGEEMLVQIERRASILNSMGVGPDTRVLIVHGGTAEFFQDLFAVWKNGACALVISPRTTSYELDNIIQSSFKPVKTVLTKGVNPGIEHPNVADLTLDRGCVEGNIRINGNLDDEALILFTSGTTGQPKGVVHTFRSLFSRTSLNQQFISRTECRNTLCVLPTHFGHGLIGNCMTALAHGNRLHLMTNPEPSNLMRLDETIDKYEINFFSSVPAAWKVVLRYAGEPKKGSIKRISVGSAPLSSELWLDMIRWSGTREVMNMYGITEAANWICGASAARFEPEDGLIGNMWGGHAAVLDGDGNVADSGEGELLVSTPALMRGYDGQPELTNSVLRQGWFHTGDQGLITKDGMYLTGRLKYQINVAGMKVQPEDIDLLLERHGKVTEACAFGVGNEISGQMVAVAIVVKGDDEATRKAALDELKSWSAERFNPDKLPKRWYLVDEIPKTDRGKVNRSVVADACRNLASH